VRDIHRRKSVRWKQAQGRRLTADNGLDGLAPSRLLTVIDLAQVQQRL
jgi:hypothetical protein